MRWDGIKGKGRGTYADGVLSTRSDPGRFSEVESEVSGVI